MKMNFNKLTKWTGMVCACGVLMAAAPKTALAAEMGPAAKTVTEMVAKIDVSGVSLYSAQDESSSVVAQAVQGNTYEVLEENGGWVKVDANGAEGYLKVEGNATLAETTKQSENPEVSQRQQVVDYALQFVGGRYKYGGSDPHTGVDCSGFTRYVMLNGGGVSLNRSSGSQAVQGRAVSAEEMQPGDLVFYGSGKRINHVGLYIGNGQIVHASTERTGIKTSPWTYRTPVKIVSVLG